MTASALQPAKFPLGLAAAAAIVAGFGPLAAMYGVQWGVDVLDRETRFAWVYTNICLAAVWLLVWPCAAMFRPASPGQRASLFKWHLPAIAIAALPAVVLAAWFSVTPPAVIARSLLLHAALAVFMLGLLSHRGRLDILIAFVAAALALLVPLAAYLQEEFLGGVSTWAYAGPLVAAARIAAGGETLFIWWTVAFYAIIGAVLVMSSPRE